MTNSTATVFPTTVGLDVGDRRTHFCALDAQRQVLTRGSFSTTPEGLKQAFAKFTGARLILEAGSQSPWMSRWLRAAGFVVQVADPRRVQLIAKDPRKTDRRDAELLARLGSAGPELLGNVHHRGEQAQGHQSVIRTRDLVVRQRAMAVAHVRSLCKAFGLRLPSASTQGFPKRMRKLVPEVLHAAVLPLLELIDEFTRRICEFERTLNELADRHYPEAQHLRQIHGVGQMISMAFVLSVEDPKRFENSRHLGSWLGLCPRSAASGDSNPQLRISKAGDPYLRRMLVQGAQYILGRFGQDCDLRRYGLHLAARGGKAAKKRAAVAVARKLAILLHRLWRTGATYDPLHHANRIAAKSSA